MNKQIIVDLVSGFLGAGKTTLISKYAAFRIKQGERVAIIENEFGEIGIDGELLKDAGLTVTEIVNGCICCTMKVDLLTTLEGMCNDNPPDRVIIEPTGIFIIEGISEILNDDRIKYTHKLCGVVTVIDALGYKKQQHRYTMFFKQQILYANRLILSKIDGMSEAEIIDTIDALRDIVGNVQIEAKSWDDLTADDWDNLFASKNNDCDCEHTHNHNHHQEEPTHGGFRGITVPCLRTLSKPELNDLLMRIVTEEFGDIPRAKGFVPNDNKGFWLFNLVGEQIKIVKATEAERDARASFIGINMNKNELAKLFS
ncbi:MAG: GTP-binding protein [Clostridiales bacterium]|nr:GTP-binding protein [Clostridiales bacterium]